MTRTRILAAMMALLAAGSAAAQGIYRWTDENGKVQYGTNPPASAKAREVRDRVNSYSGPVEVQRAPAPAPGKSAVAAAQVVMYATSWCGYCAQARAYFAKKGIAFVEHDVEKSAAANADFKRLGGKGVPLIVYAGYTMSGFNEQGFESLVARAKR